MNRFRRLIHEIHRRSLWQVLGIFAAAGVRSFAVLGLAASGFMGMRAMGIGPAATLLGTNEGATETMIEAITPILYVDAIEPVLPFWVDRLGFTVTSEVPEGDRLGFVILERDGTQVMVQTRASVEADVPGLADTPMGGTILFIRVDDLEPIIDALDGAPVLVPRRETFYGADEIFVREPGGNIVGFAAFTSEDAGG